MSIHYEAMEHLDKAKALIAAGGNDNLRYAALEMRYCIEHLFYKIIPQYRDELPDNVSSGEVWKPADIINMIADIDPGAIHDRRVRIGFEDVPGVPARTMYEVGRQTGLRKDLARRLWNGLGFYLHARVDQKPHDATKLRHKLQKVLPRLEEFRGDRIIINGFDLRTSSKCQDCGRSMSRRLGAVKDNPYMNCPSSKCGAVYMITDVDGSRARWDLVQENLKCQKCGVDNWLGLHAWKRGARENATLACSGCSTTYQLFEYVMVKEANNDVFVEPPA